MCRKTATWRETLRVDLLKLMGAEIGHVGELVFAKVFPNAARGDHVAMLLEAMYSARRLTPQRRQFPQEKSPGIYSRHVSAQWPIHKSWFVPAVVDSTPRLLVNPPRRIVKYIGRDVDGTYAYLLSVGLTELSSYAQDGTAPSLIDGHEVFSDSERQTARELYTKTRDVGREFFVEVIDTLKDVDFLVQEDGGVYHVEVKTTTRPTDFKLRKKKEMLRRRQRILEKLEIKPMLAVVVPRENWEVEIYLEKI